MTVSAGGGGGSVLGAVAIAGGATGGTVAGVSNVHSTAVSMLPFTGAGHVTLLLVISALLVLTGVLLVGLGRRHRAGPTG